jgi:CubicO group peptidase (beta-lactamase class C family)
MVSYNRDLSYGSKEWSYDGDASREVNAFNDVALAVLAQDPARLGADLEQFAQKFVMQPLGLEDTVWTDGQPVKRFGGGWTMTIKDMARMGLLMLNGGMWNGQRLIAQEWIYRMTHPSFEDGHTGYGYLTWLSSKSNWRSYSGGRLQGPSFAWSPHAVWNSYPHRFSDAPDCNYDAPYDCAQMFDAGVWYAAGAGGQYVIVHPGLEMVVAVKDAGMEDAQRNTFWNRVLPAIVALDPMFKGDQQAFCEAYGNNRYAPDLRPRKGP